MNYVFPSAEEERCQGKLYQRADNVVQFDISGCNIRPTWPAWCSMWEDRQCKSDDNGSEMFPSVQSFEV